jgi:hypothetical protein
MIECTTNVVHPLAELFEWLDDGDMAMKFLKKGQL